MDNLRSLNSSLPTPTSSRRQRSRHDRQPSQQQQQALLQAFKTAALSVTNLYRAAATDGAAVSYADGYRDALEDLVDFLDREDLGLTDGDGWRVRQYLADRLAQSPATATGGQQTGTDGSEDEAGDAEEEKRARSSSPVTQTKSVLQEQAQPQAASDDAVRSGSAPPSQDATTAPQLQFTFEAGHAYPGPPQVQDMDMDASVSQHQQQSTHRTPRGQRHGMLRLNSNSHNRSATSLAGSKRKIPMLDFFDISGFGNGKDGTSGGGAGGGKRNRLA